MFLRRILKFLFRLWLGRAARQTVNEVKAKGVVAYLRILQGVRLSALGVVTALIALQMLSVGLILMVGAAIWLAPWDAQLKLWLCLGAGAVFFFLPLGILLLIFSEKVWFEATGAKRMAEQALGES